MRNSACVMPLALFIQILHMKERLKIDWFWWGKRKERKGK
jgi:hypothetical protein